ncbi:MAG: extradiol ring-cleavage dioxygenase [Gammaproteobacteria bacterium]|nr:extradiol ring-cleavage dioxygenase [Gammaproteobacteria bacterium]
MSLVFAGVCSHAPGITGRADMADAGDREAYYSGMARMREALEASRPDALIVIAAEHFANFFMNNMPAYCIGMADEYDGPIEDPDWLGIPHTTVPAAPALSRRLVVEVMRSVDVAYAEEWRFDHGIMVPLSFLTPRYDLPIIPANINCQGPPLTPLHRAFEFGRALRRACDAVPERIALIGTGGISHWPATPDSGKINVDWDRDFLDRWTRNDRDALLSYTDAETHKDAGQGGFEIRTFIAVSGATEGCRAEVWCYKPIPIFAVGCTVGVVDLPAVP